ncbi:uncharacterized protein LOC114533445 [Dendronephthya gigantea]|uniref:uncharacterized protein LOC114533445 n=1 Tax=Dendronephthya gigantea TaxID=151771 RepID=UPI00106B1E09|nr:uncharacterized protein LOC114533445 [Dendronephthya gigantea]XP_028410763.1 uncharacterized protein LOC114533445 [Dendronephthya gigantea]XP_028410764.1 uncharacterized protein LOC114533445 [Dendronephthya gigantea]XP_028410765.1 uncharacterized protein LOC114533445 [Dendronephthya gigantea]
MVYTKMVHKELSKLSNNLLTSKHRLRLLYHNLRRLYHNHLLIMNNLRMGAKRNQHKPIIFGNCKAVLQTVIMVYFAANLVFGEEEEETKFCKRGWTEFVGDRKQWERECLINDARKMSPCCNETADYLEERYEKYIKLCPILEGECKCNFQEQRVDGFAYGDMSDPVSWTKPNISCTHKCQLHQLKVVPSLRSPRSLFPVGLKKIEYVFKLYGGLEKSCTIMVYIHSFDSKKIEEVSKKNNQTKVSDCKKDILVLWNNSNFVDFDPNIKEFLKKFIKNKKLDVKRRGTHLGFISFSNSKGSNQRSTENWKN